MIGRNGNKRKLPGLGSRDAFIGKYRGMDKNINKRLI